MRNIRCIGSRRMSNYYGKVEHLNLCIPYYGLRVNGWRMTLSSTQLGRNTEI